MSLSSQTTSSRAIPATRRVILSDAAHLPHDYSSTPGGTLFSTTPGGTRIIYDRKFLLDCRSSPLAHTPPSCLPDIPGVTSPPKNNKTHPRERVSCSSSIPPVDKATGEDAQFEMDI
ncbi:eukaryotic translation initiation factor 4E-binding protein 1 [Ictalurus furcatus]|uniref:eukaryotic translation initiation factor 4E-binding protein 1 n=1 Tax=Ictalurus furcatus TaxID=66913 RepID=UPI002350DF4A|nr:eukaryotic translation initiation factor 4E-binding protein 1 [Ictalurus furcatus]XP_053505186.1 eukaryotic translation initiation factor 4E-binding protein 1 [Ictalurus furcatus]XP_053505187.1 eukaryotic translation initiation factor 4E-binding protein 1 [Ictalurus furcatus]